MEIRNHSSSTEYVVVIDPTDEALALARKSARSCKVQENGKIVVHKSFRSQFDTMIAQQTHASTTVPTFGTTDEMREWTDEHMNSGKAVSYFYNMSAREFNARFAGKSLAEAEQYGIEMTR